MWIVNKTTVFDKQNHRALPDGLRQSLINLWLGEGDTEAEKDVEQLIESLHEEGLWLACDCHVRRGEVDLPLMAPAFLRSQGTYYLRRLYGKIRPLHHKSCVFFGEPNLGDERLIEWETPEKPDGYFLLEDDDTWTPKKEDLRDLRKAFPQNTYDGDPVRRRDSLLRRQLWRLIERARLNLLAPPVRGRKPSYKFEYAAIKDAAELIHVGPGLPLGRVLETVPNAFERRSIIAKVLQHKDQFEPHCAPQGWMCFYAQTADRTSITVKMQRGDVQIVPERGVDVIPGGSPYLALVQVAAGVSKRHVPLKAVVQPVLNGRRFFPVMDHRERSQVDAMVSTQFSLLKARPDLALGYRRNFFPPQDDDIPGSLHAIVTNMTTGQLSELCISGADMENLAAERLGELLTEWAIATPR